MEGMDREDNVLTHKDHDNGPLIFAPSGVVYASRSDFVQTFGDLLKSQWQ